MKPKPIQFEFLAAADAFNLVLESTVDGDRARQEMDQAARDAFEARQIEAQRQTTLIPDPA